MKRAKTIYSGTLNARKAAEFFDRMHCVKDAAEQIAEQYTQDLGEIITELSDAQSIDPALIRMAFTQERQKRKREARIANMDGGKAHQLDLLADAAAGSAALGDVTLSRVVAATKAAGPKVSDVVDHLKSGELNLKLVEKIAQGVQTAAGRAALLTAVDTMIERVDAETGEITAIPAGPHAGENGRPDTKVEEASSIPAHDRSGIGLVETTGEMVPASKPDAVAGASGPSSSPTIPSFLLRKQPEAVAAE